LSLFEELREQVVVSGPLLIKNILELLVELEHLVDALLNFFTALSYLLKQDFFGSIRKISLGVINMIHLAFEAEIAVALLAVSNNPLVLMTRANK
jgi:hypothetical protein